jgi:hypothetical protein
MSNSIDKCIVLPSVGGGKRLGVAQAQRLAVDGNAALARLGREQLDVVGSYMGSPPEVMSTSSAPARTTTTVAPSTALARVFPTVSFMAASLQAMAHVCQLNFKGLYQ